MPVCLCAISRWPSLDAGTLRALCSSYICLYAGSVDVTADMSVLLLVVIILLVYLAYSYTFTKPHPKFPPGKLYFVVILDYSPPSTHHLTDTLICVFLKQTRTITFTGNFINILPQSNNLSLRTKFRKHTGHDNQECILVLKTNLASKEISFFVTRVQRDPCFLKAVCGQPQERQ